MAFELPKMLKGHFSVKYRSDPYADFIQTSLLAFFFHANDKSSREYSYLDELQMSDRKTIPLELFSFT